MDLQEKLNEGHVHAKVIIEILGKPKEHVESTLKSFVEKIRQNKDFHVMDENFNEAEEQEGVDAQQKGTFFSAFVELEILFKNLPALQGFCFDYMPSSIDVMAPEELKMQVNDISNFMNDLQARLHQLDMLLKQAKTQNEFLKKNMFTLLRNNISLLLLKGPLDLAKLSQLSGVPDTDLKEFLEQLKKDNILEEKEGAYSLVQKDAGQQTQG